MTLSQDEVMKLRRGHEVEVEPLSQGEVELVKLSLYHKVMHDYHKVMHGLIDRVMTASITR